MNEKLKKYLDGIFSPYKDLKETRELKEELFTDLQEKFNDLKSQGYDDETAYNKTVNSVGDISEIVESITAKTQQKMNRNFSKVTLKHSDLKKVEVHDGKFNSSDLQGSDFSGSDLKNSSFQTSDLRNVTFDDSDLTRARLRKVDLRKASFKNCVFDHTDFSYSDLSGVCFDNQTFTGTIFDNSGLKETSFQNAVFRNVSFRHSYHVKKAVFDGAAMDKLTYAVLKGSKANLTNVTVV